MNLADWMKARELDDEAVGALVGADRVTISRIRRGLNKPSWMLAAKLKDASSGDVTANDFLPSLEEVPSSEAAQ